MLETKDPAIRLFGKTIPVPVNEEIPAFSGNDYSGVASAAHDDTVDHDPPSTTTRTSSQDKKSEGGEDQEQSLDEKDHLDGKSSETKEGNGTPTSDTSSGIDEDPKTASSDKEATILNSSKTEEKSETSSSPEKTLKKPDKILPCPRCNSMDTKFCYYNNYNVNQPRHFCKNCQRYWTTGGTMRNVPVGAGRRKNKNSASHYRHMTVSEALQTARVDASNGIHHPALKTNGTVLTFGSDAPLCESMASVLKLAEKGMQNCTHNGFHRPEELRIPVCHGVRENRDDNSSGSSITALNTMEEARKVRLPEPVMPNCNGFPHQMPCYPGAPSPLPYTWNSPPWGSAVPPPQPAFCPSTFPISFYPAATYWGCSIPGTWNVPWLFPASPKHGTSISNPNAETSISNPNAPTLGKHSRDGEMLKPSTEKEEQPKQNNSERCLWIPKTLRIDDPGEAAKSSIWATLGIKNDKANSISGGRHFKAFQSKVDEKNHIARTSPVLQANPAALSRSLNFRETS